MIGTVLITAALSWEVNHAERKPWSNKVVNMVLEHRGSLFAAQDMTTFCPKFNSLSMEEKSWVWAELIVGIVKYESDFDPNNIYHEPPPLSIDSIGLLQLSYEDKAQYPFCNLNRKTKNLQDPINNLDCGIKIMAKLIDKWGVITNSKNRGLAAYWSVVRKSRPSYSGIIKHVKTKVKACL